MLCCVARVLLLQSLFLQLLVLCGAAEFVSSHFAEFAYTEGMLVPQKSDATINFTLNKQNFRHGKSWFHTKAVAVAVRDWAAWLYLWCNASVHLLLLLYLCRYIGIVVILPRRYHLLFAQVGIWVWLLIANCASKMLIASNSINSVIITIIVKVEMWDVLSCYKYFCYSVLLVNTFEYGLKTSND